MTRSDSSDSSRSHRSKHKKKNKRHRSRSESSSSDERSSSKKSSRKHKSDRRRRSRSREAERSRDRRRSRSRDRKRQSRSRSRSKSPTKQSSGWDETKKPKTSSGWDQSEDKLSLKDKIRLLTGGTTTTGEQSESYTPTAEQIGKIENANFVQENFSSTYIDPSAMPKQKKKKKNKQKQGGNSNKQMENDVERPKMETVSHEDAMFANTMNTMHLTKFSNSGGPGERGGAGKNVVHEDSIFGAMFFDDSEVRRKRWIVKLTKLREKFVDEGA